MKSRMEKYYDLAESRVSKNEDIYTSLKNDKDLKETVNIENTNEIDLSNLKKINKREEYKKLKHYKEIMGDRENEAEEIVKEVKEDKIYNINQVLEKAKENRESINECEKYRKLRCTQYDILTKLDVNKKVKEDVINEEEELKELINTITTNSLLERKKNKEGYGFFDDLVSSGETKVINPINQNKKCMENEELDEKDETMDHSFYTNTFTFSKEDFDGLQNIEETVKFNNILIKVLLSIIFIIICVIVFYVFKNLI